MVPESSGATPAGKATFSLVTAWAGSKVTLWVMTPGLVQVTVSPTLQFTVAGTKIALGLFFIVTSMVAAAMAGAAGALFTQTSGFSSLDVFEFHRSADLMLMLVVGGTGWLYGGVTGAVAFKLLQDFLASQTPQYWTFWLGLFLVVLVLVGHERL